MGIGGKKRWPPHLLEHLTNLNQSVRRIYGLDMFFSENNEATSLLPDSNEWSFKAESNDTNYDHNFKIIGSVLGHFST